MNIWDLFLITTFSSNTLNSVKLLYNWIIFTIAIYFGRICDDDKFWGLRFEDKTVSFIMFRSMTIFTQKIYNGAKMDKFNLKSD